MPECAPKTIVNKEQQCRPSSKTSSTSGMVQNLLNSSSYERDPEYVAALSSALTAAAKASDRRFVRRFSRKHYQKQKVALCDAHNSQSKGASMNITTEQAQKATLHGRRRAEQLRLRLEEADRKNRDSSFGKATFTKPIVQPTQKYLQAPLLDAAPKKQVSTGHRRALQMIPHMKFFGNVANNAPIILQTTCIGDSIDYSEL